jgi:hypothetical protein
MQKRRQSEQQAQNGRLPAEEWPVTIGHDTTLITPADQVYPSSGPAKAGSLAIAMLEARRAA